MAEYAKICLLLDAGADPNICAKGHTCLHYAVICSDYPKEIFQTLINKGANVNATNHKNRTAMLLACIERKADLINILLNAGADPNIATTNGNTCLHAAATYDVPQEVVQTIIDHGADVNATNKKNRTALLIAYKLKNTDIINTLLNARADPNIVFTDGNTCLHYAVQYRFFPKEAIQDTINKGANVNAANHKNQIVVLLACKKGNTNIIKMLLDAGADPNIADTNDNTCLHYAVCYGAENYFPLDVFQAIIDQGADVNATNQQK